MPSSFVRPRLYTLVSRFASILFVGTLMLAGLFLGTPAASAASTLHASASKGILTPAGTVDLRKLSPGKTSQTASHRHLKGTHRLPRRGSPTGVTMPTVAASAVDAAHAGTLLSNF